MDNKYRSLEHFRTERIQARQVRDMHAQNIAHRVALLKHPHTRGILLRDAVGDVIRRWEPYRRVHGLLSGHISGSTVAAIGMAIASTRRGIVKKLLYSGASMLLGKVIGDEPGHGNDSNLLSTLATSIGGVVRRMRERKRAREEEELEA